MFWEECKPCSYLSFITIPKKMFVAALRDSIAVVPIVNCMSHAILQTMNCINPQQQNMLITALKQMTIGKICKGKLSFLNLYSGHITRVYENVEQQRRSKDYVLFQILCISLLINTYLKQSFHKTPIVRMHDHFQQTFNALSGISKKYNNYNDLP